MNIWNIYHITKTYVERRLGLYPALFDKQESLYSMTEYGDYPLIMPQRKIADLDEIFPGWMLLSFNKKVKVSSAIDALPAKQMTNESIRTYWAAKSGDSSKYAIMDLGKEYDVYAIQLNFSEHNRAIFGRQKDLFQSYSVAYSNGRTNWIL